MNTIHSLQGRIDAVVIGASAGGVEALNVILPALQAAKLPPIFIVVHLLRDQPSLLPEIFESKCPLLVKEALDKETIESGTVYFAPPDYHLLIDTGPAIALSRDELVNFSRPSIDVLFESAADVYRERLLGIVLSGANSDGTAGLDSIHRAGGVTVVQDPASARVPTMVLSALEHRRADFVLSLEEIAQLLRTLDNSALRATSKG